MAAGNGGDGGSTWAERVSNRVMGQLIETTGAARIQVIARDLMEHGIPEGIAVRLASESTLPVDPWFTTEALSGMLTSGGMRWMDDPRKAWGWWKQRESSTIRTRLESNFSVRPLHKSQGCFQMSLEVLGTAFAKRAQELALRPRSKLVARVRRGKKAR